MNSIPISPEQLAWEHRCSRAITSDAIWKLDVYRDALFLLHLAQSDCQSLREVRGTEVVTGQLSRAAPSVSANLSEGYSRSTRSDRLRFVDYALGSVRECVTWYESARGSMPDETIEDRLALLMRIRAQLLGVIRSSRERQNKAHFEP
jgi:four helix bundle protein